MARISSIGRNDLWVLCVLCTHYSRWRLVDLQNKVGYDAELSHVVRRLKCSNCGTHSAAIKFRPPSNDLKLLQRYKKAR